MMAGRRVLVTGGGSGAGADLALGFAHAGAAEVVRDHAEPISCLCETRGRQATA